MSDDKKCEKTDCKLYDKSTSDNCGKMIEGRQVGLCQGYIEAPRPQDSLGSAGFDLLDAEQLEAERIKGRTEAMEFIGELVEVYRKNDMINAAEMLEREIDNFADC